MVEYDEFEQYLRKFKIIDNSLTILLDACIAPNKPFASSLITRYGCVELANFLKYYDKFLGFLNEQQKKSVLCFAGFLKEIFDNRNGLIKLRNNWTAHIQDEDKFSEDITEFIKKMNLPKNIDDYCIMICGVSMFVAALLLLFEEEFQQTRDKFNQSQDAKIEQEFIHSDLIRTDIAGKAKIAKKKIELGKVFFPWERFEQRFGQQPKFRFV